VGLLMVERARSRSTYPAKERAFGLARQEPERRFLERRLRAAGL